MTKYLQYKLNIVTNFVGVAMMTYVVAIMVALNNPLGYPVALIGIGVGLMFVKGVIDAVKKYILFKKEQ